MDVDIHRTAVGYEPGLAEVGSVTARAFDSGGDSRLAVGDCPRALDAGHRRRDVAQVSHVLGQVVAGMHDHDGQKRHAEAQHPCEVWEEPVFHLFFLCSKVVSR